MVAQTHDIRLRPLGKSGEVEIAIWCIGVGNPHTLVSGVRRKDLFQSTHYMHLKRTSKQDATSVHSRWQVCRQRETPPPRRRPPPLMTNRSLTSLRPSRCFKQRFLGTESTGMSVPYFKHIPRIRFDPN